VLESLIANYLTTLRIERKSPATIAYHERGLGLLERWARNQALVHPDEIDKDRMREFILWLQTRPKKAGRPMSAVTARNEIGSARTFVN